MFSAQIILASSSPRRKQLLNKVGVNVDVFAVHIDESAKPQEVATDYVARVSREKLTTAKAALTEHPLNLEFATEDKIIISADTIGVLDGDILTKPKDKADAFSMWQRMSGRCHEVITSVCACKGSTKEERIWQLSVTTKVYFIALNDHMMQTYWQTGEPADKAGGYAIQGAAAAWVDKIEGCYSNVVGLPVAKTLKMLNDMTYIVI